MCFCLSVEMMGHPELQTECNINQLEPLLPQDVVDDLLSKYVQTFTVRTHTHKLSPVQLLWFTFVFQSQFADKNQVELNETWTLNLLFTVPVCSPTSQGG